MTVRNIVKANVYLGFGKLSTVSLNEPFTWKSRMNRTIKDLANCLTLKKVYY